MTTNIIRIGDPLRPRITAFGDDSKFKRTNVFSYVLFENDRLEWSREALCALKRKYGLPQTVQMHMRSLANARYRNENGITHLTAEVLLQFVSEVVERMNEAPFLVRAAYFHGDLPTDIAEPEWGARWSDKGIQSMLAKLALVPLNLQRHKYTDLRIVVSADATLVSFLGTRRRRADRWARGFSDIEAPPGHVYEFTPVIAAPESDILLQLADVVVYLIAHAFDREKVSLRHRLILENVRNIDVQPIQFSD
jgi:hypothetical protein